MSTSDPFLSGLTAEKQSRESAAANVPRGHVLCLPQDVGIFFPAGSVERSRKVYHRPANTPDGLAAWERQATETHDKIEREGGAALVLVMQGHPIGSKGHRDRLQAYREGRLQLPSLAEFMGLKSTNNAEGIVKNAVRRETNEQLEARLARQRRERAEGVRLQRVEL